MTPTPARALRASILAATLLATSGCREHITPFVPDSELIARMTITAQPSAPTMTPVVGWSELGLETSRDGRLYVPPSYTPGTPARLLVLLHGAGGSGQAWQSNTVLKTWADEHGIVILAPDSRFPTWDVIVTGEYDEDVAFLNRALLHTFARVAVDPTKIAIAGFSDGASEAIGIGVANAGLFRKIMAFSPGMAVTPFTRGNPAVFASAGDEDTSIFLRLRDVIVPNLRSNGMVVTFLPFQGGHVLPDGVIQEAMQWLLEI